MRAGERWRPMGDVRAWAMAPVAALLVASCSGGGPALLSAAAPGAVAPVATAVAMSPEEVAASGTAAPPNPFADLTDAPAGGREVIETPTLAEVLDRGSPLPEMAWGRPDAPVTVVKYASLTCPFCRQFHTDVYPLLKRTYIDTGKVRFILREFPIGRTSGQASVALRCAPAAKYLDLYARYLNTQPRWVSQEVRPDAIHAIAAEVGLSRAAFEACRQDAALIEGLKLMKDRGRKLGIIGTPNFFIGAKRIKKALDWPALQAEIEPLLARGAAAVR